MKIPTPVPIRDARFGTVVRGLGWLGVVPVAAINHGITASAHRSVTCDMHAGPAFTLLTIEPGSDVAPIHGRQMVVLERADWLAWLDLTGARSGRA